MDIFQYSRTPFLLTRSLKSWLFYLSWKTTSHIGPCWEVVFWERSHCITGPGMSYWHLYPALAQIPKTLRSMSIRYRSDTHRIDLYLTSTRALLLSGRVHSTKLSLYLVYYIITTSIFAKSPNAAFEIFGIGCSGQNDNFSVTILSKWQHLRVRIPLDKNVSAPDRH